MNEIGYRILDNFTTVIQRFKFLRVGEFLLRLIFKSLNVRRLTVSRHFPECLIMQIESIFACLKVINHIKLDCYSQRQDHNGHTRNI